MTKKEKVIEALSALNDWRSSDCIEFVNQCDDITKLVLPVSMMHLRKVVDAALEDVQ